MRFIIHLGLGKTGSTSIQQHLRQHFDALQQQGVLYAGLRFETLAPRQHWQRGAGTYTKLSDEELLRQLSSFATKYVEYASSINAHTIVLSNETFSAQLTRLKPFFDWLISKYDVRFSVYVREIDSWLVSAYEQWGLKDTPDSKKVMTFAEFANAGRHHIAGNCLEQLQEFGYLEHTYIKNMHKAKNGDVTEDFFHTFNLPLIASPQKSNESSNKRQRAYFYLSNLHRLQKHKVHSLVKQERELNKPSAEHQKFVQQCVPSLDVISKESVLKEKHRVNRFLPEAEQLSETVSFKKVDNNIDAFTFNLMDSHIKYQNLSATLNPSVLIEAAAKLKPTDIKLSLQLLNLASISRPNGKVIKQRIAEYKALLDSGYPPPPNKSIGQKILHKMRKILTVK